MPVDLVDWLLTGLQRSSKDLKEMAASKEASFIIPTVDISAYLQDPSSDAAAQVVKQIETGCRTSGFFQITHHGIPTQLRDTVLNASKTFFTLPNEEKEKYYGGPGRGYEKIGEQVLEPGTKPELKEGYFIARNDPTRLPPYRAFEAPNIWPTPSIPDSTFKEPLLAYHDAVSSLARTLMDMLAHGLNLSPSIFSAFCHEPVASVRLLHYPPHPTSKDPNLRGAGAHTDFGAITLLLQDESSGLQVLNKESGEWIDVPPNKDAYVVNVGDMLERWTNGGYKSTVHRVINTSGTDRYSVPFFYDGNLDFVIKPLVDGDGREEEEGFTVEQHMLERYKASYVDNVKP
ncbi:hypothetical protein BDV96DRAFT_297086 [Lophiotrema nucula]|uniref:Fe2OG dioxygenase domain-containing protein n=1 Tax=Lophiotrema nucula TaxID=690887 RepID=A0A6A5YN36_9PLEO|nr:hypothetical protein BDV96DRAFT_297086 [Lophiotrema nucula]